MTRIDPLYLAVCIASVLVVCADASQIAPSRTDLTPERLNVDASVVAQKAASAALSTSDITNLKKQKHVLEKKLRKIEHELASAGALHHAEIETAPHLQKPAVPSAVPTKAGKGPRERTFSAAFLASIAMIIASELGDKTFFIAAIMAMRHNRVVVFSSAIAALALMTVLSSVLGVAVPQLLPKQYVSFASTLLFFVFGVKLLKESYEMDPSEPNEELDEVEMEVDKKELESSGDMEGGVRRTQKAPLFSPIFVQCFTMTFLAEWGDRSQIATIAMAAAKDPYGVTAGGVIGHALCTGLAVVGGKVLATSISERSVAAIGGVLFLVFGLHGYYSGDMDISGVY